MEVGWVSGDGLGRGGLGLVDFGCVLDLGFMIIKGPFGITINTRTNFAKF